MSKVHQLYAQKAAPTWSGLVATLNDPTFFVTHLSAPLASAPATTHGRDGATKVRLTTSVPK